MAGGKGTRLWPISRKNKPKQFQCLTSDKTMLQETFLRMRKRFDIKDIYISTNEEYISEVEKEILELPKENIVSEPMSRGSASSIALTLAIITARNENETIMFFPSDHLVKNPELLIASIEKAEIFLKTHQDHMVTLGVNPTSPETGFGYIEKGEMIDKTNGFEIFNAKRFVEKPDMETAQKYLESGNFFWNTAMYMCWAEPLINKFKKFIPDTYNRLLKIKKAVDTDKYPEVLLKEYPEMDKIDFAYSIVENDANIAVMPLSLDWSDVGSWTLLKNTLSENSKKHFVKGEHIDFDCENLLVYGSKKLITTIGVKDLIIVDTEDAILICDLNKSKLVSDVVKHLEETGKITLL
ncbi:MAG: sugar phosphate nucleotidyltransferase [Patescibacteria group bacterium]